MDTLAESCDSLIITFFKYLNKMGNKRRRILLLMLHHQTMFRSYMMLCLLTLQYKKLVGKR